MKNKKALIPFGMRAFVRSGSDDVQDKGEHNEDEGKDRRELGELGVPGLGLSLGQEVVGAAGDRTGETGALSALHQNDHGEGKAGNQLKNRKNNGNGRHNRVNPF